MCGNSNRSSQIEEFLDTGHISEARKSLSDFTGLPVISFDVVSISDSPRFIALSLFSSVYGIGPNTARRLYALGLRTLDDLEAYYGVDPSEVKDEREFVELEKPSEKGHYASEASTSRAGGKPDVKGRWNDGSELGEDWVKIALGLREDLGLKSVYL